MAQILMNTPNTRNRRPETPDKLQAILTPELWDYDAILSTADINEISIWYERVVRRTGKADGPLLLALDAAATGLRESIAQHCCPKAESRLASALVCHPDGLTLADLTLMLGLPTGLIRWLARRLDERGIVLIRDQQVMAKDLVRLREICRRADAPLPPDTSH